MGIDFKRLNGDAVSSLQSICDSMFTGGHVRGHEYVCKNPTRQDSAPGSFSINLKTGIWADFATGDKGSDPVSLIAYVHSCRQIDAAKTLATMLGRDYSDKPKSEYNPADWVLVQPVPDDAPPLPTERAMPVNNDWVRYPISHYWRYTDRLGATIGYVTRYETPTGKETPPLVLKRNVKTGTMKWVFSGMPKPRPLYNLAKLVSIPAPQVIIVEGEKCAETLQGIMDTVSPQIAVVTWPGGAQSIAHADFSPVAHAAKIMLWPDNTAEKDPGFETMLRIAAIIKSHGVEAPIKIIRKQPDRPDGWDCADGILYDGWDSARILAFMREQADELPAVLPDARPAPVSGQLPAPADDSHRDESDRPFRVLGFDGDNRFFYPIQTCQVMKIPFHKLTMKNFLLGLAPLHYWEHEFPGPKGAAWDLAAGWIHNACTTAGPFNVSKIRGRGVWIDGDRKIVNLGRELVVNGERVPFGKIKSDFVYQAGAVIEHTAVDPLPDGEGIKLLDITKELFWESDSYGIFLAGWLAIAPICGGLTVRPHIWLTGPSKAGKTSVVDKIIKPCLGNLMLSTQSATSEAGIRQSIGHDALPVLIDEFESDDNDDLKRVEKILILARQAFSGDAPIIKGGQSGNPQTYIVRSCFFMSAINVSISQTADKTRILVLRMMEPFERGSLSPDDQWRKLKSTIESTLTPEWCAALRARSISLLSTINENARIFATAVSAHLASSRTGDQMGPILAGFWSLKTSAIISEDEAVRIVKNIDWRDHAENNDITERDEIQCLRKIVSASVRINHTEYSIAEMIGELVEAEPDSGDDFRKALARYGIKISDNRLTLHISKSQTAIENVLDKTPWKKSYFELLKRVAGLVKTCQMSIDGTRRQVVNIPISKILG